MKPPAFAYHAPSSLDEATGLLAELGDDGKVLAGGQSLVPMLNMRLAAPRALVDITRMSGLDEIEVTAEEVRVGARVTHERLRRDEAAFRALPLLRQALDWVAHTVIRNRGTSVGSIVHADPAAELPAVLALLGGHVELHTTDGRRDVPASEFLLAPLTSDVRVGELAAAVSFPRPGPRTGSAFVELARRHGDYALVGVAVLVGLDADRHVESARAAFIGAGPTPERIELTDVLAGQRHDALHVDEALARARSVIEPEDDVHASASYRRHLAGVLLERGLRDAAERAAGEGRS